MSRNLKWTYPLTYKFKQKKQDLKININPHSLFVGKWYATLEDNLAVS